MIKKKKRVGGNNKRKLEILEEVLKLWKIEVFDK